MADYWKSQPKKFCEACKCWFADNKAWNLCSHCYFGTLHFLKHGRLKHGNVFSKQIALDISKSDNIKSIDFHERGKNHQANVQKRITEIMKKGKKMQKAQLNYENIMDGINQAALQAFEKDVKTGGSKIDAYRYAAEEAKLKEKAAEKEQANLSTPAAQVVSWFEGVTEGGDTYYWNMETGESTWEKPECDYVPLSKQQEPRSESEAPEDDPSQEPDSSIGPAPKASPYGEWQVVRPKEAPKIDLQLPQKPEGVEEVVISVPSDAPTKMKFVEKTVGSLESEEGEDASSVFKKRKFGSHSKRNVRQRTDDD